MYTVACESARRQGIRALCGKVHTSEQSYAEVTPRASEPHPFRDTPSRGERKEATRRAIIDAALKLLEERSFSGLSLREVTREAGIVPAAFYRHFDSMDAPRSGAHR